MDDSKERKGCEEKVNHEDKVYREILCIYISMHTDPIVYGLWIIDGSWKLVRLNIGEKWKEPVPLSMQNLILQMFFFSQPLHTPPP